MLRACPARLFAVVLSLALPGCGESDGPTSPTSPPGSTTATVRLLFMGFDGTRRAKSPGFSAQACVNGVGHDSHAPELARLRRSSPASRAAGPLRNHVRRPCPPTTRVSLRVERSELLRRESDRRGHAERVREAVSSLDPGTRRLPAPGTSRALRSPSPRTARSVSRSSVGRLVGRAAAAGGRVS